jgi:hypothetical protein
MKRKDNERAMEQARAQTGGPAVRITGDLADYGEPETASIEYQDWFTQ